MQPKLSRLFTTEKSAEQYMTSMLDSDGSNSLQTVSQLKRVYSKK